MVVGLNTLVRGAGPAAPPQHGHRGPDHHFRRGRDAGQHRWFQAGRHRPGGRHRCGPQPAFCRRMIRRARQLCRGLGSSAKRTRCAGWRHAVLRIFCMLPASGGTMLRGGKPSAVHVRGGIVPHRQVPFHHAQAESLFVWAGPRGRGAGRRGQDGRESRPCFLCGGLRAVGLCHPAGRCPSCAPQGRWPPREAARLLSMFSQKTAASTRALPAQPSGLKDSSQNSQTQMVLRMGSR